MMIKIGNTALRHGLMLAPMAGVTDLAMRKICADRGAEYAVSEMVSAKALVYEQEARATAPVKTAALCKIDGEIPTAIQIFGSDSEFMAEAARLLSSGEYRGFCGILRRIACIGDSLSSDISGGKNAGIKTCWYNPQRKPLDEGYQVDVEIQDLHDIYEVLDLL